MGIICLRNEGVVFKNDGHSCEILRKGLFLLLKSASWLWFTAWLFGGKCISNRALRTE